MTSRFAPLVAIGALMIAACSGSSDRSSVSGAASAEHDASPVTVSDRQRELMTPGPGRLPVTFRHDAPDADTVLMEFTANYWNRDPADTVELLRVDDDESSHALTLQLGSDQWLYRYRVDGRWETDDFAEEQVGAENGMFNSVVRVGTALPDSTPVPAGDAGTVETLTIDSEVLGRPIPYVLYTPAGRHERPLRILVLLHGYGQPATDWAEAVGIGDFMDNLIADRRVEPFAIVMPSGENSNYVGNRALHIVDEVVPDARRRLGPVDPSDTDPAAMAVGGFSQGGAGALRLSSLRPDEFGLTMPIAMAGPCGGRCDTSLYEQTYPEGFRSEFEMWVGVDDELGLDVEHDRFVEYANALDITVVDHRTASDGHVTSGHSIRYVRTIAVDVLLRAAEYFAT